MVDVYFHYSNSREVMIAQRGAAVSDLAEACEYAERVVRSLIKTPSTEDWRAWALHASDDSGDEIFVMPFASVLGKPH